MLPQIISTSVRSG